MDNNEKLETFNYPSEKGIIIELNGKKILLSERDSGLIISLRAKPSEFRIELLNLTIVELDAYVKSERMKIADSFRKMFEDKCSFRETGDLVSWKELLRSGLELSDDITPRRLIQQIENGTITIEFTIELLDQILDTVKLNC